jgi:hypothetical protein
MHESMPRAAQPAGHLSANSSSGDRPDRSPLPRFSLVSHSLFTNSFPSPVVHPPGKYFRIKCVDDFHFRSKYIAATHSRRASTHLKTKWKTASIAESNA